MVALDKSTVDAIRTKNEDVFLLLQHIDALESFLDKHDNEDAFGTEGWRHAIEKERSE